MSKNKAEITATWDLSLKCKCPKCEEYVDLLCYNYFWDTHESLKPVENGTALSNSLDVTCPECEHEFEVCCGY